MGTWDFEALSIARYIFPVSVLRPFPFLEKRWSICNADWVSTLTFLYVDVTCSAAHVSLALYAGSI